MIEGNFVIQGHKGWVIADDRIERLGRYFIHNNIAGRYGITFEQFIKIVDRGDWEEVVA